ncbi:UNVERIFIED_ORG: drug/metabolite transporter (DMT)-like permease [Pseudomonas parafulva]|jgi:drug/metabolite transporter (DMT)-like permease|uniref:EamA family transporter n=2 Tax=Pseudomonas TaxID=286 RepID=UPI0003C5AB5A|nr:MULTISPECIES: EamA family transporter [Pseudomonas]HCL51656.1 4-amino-4-deoxy-L-arabinose-phospho-UDP flippase [Pseudomonas sp.]AVF54721.1 4-amino-4-deoxy-L-arabinose-phospho-UDP flippase [Pseudomonas fulva]EST13742.1 eamA-like transporter family protein [Pseudomonas putida S610]KTS93927.1 4-amino-4-deoxy-L-arabinose-phospho-UDP flippase subunit E [Pseudomonas parafulva]MBA1220941.1 4-amino-4-deoxy-L-arabinose-phospho-UDP flippase [Pseudomonas fulva]
MMYAIAILCVVGIATGQIMFKLSASALQRAGTIFDLKTLMILGSAFALYGVTTIAWVWVLQKIELGKAYPLMALAFVLVPIGSHFILGERFQVQYFIGVAFIMFGIVLAVKS